MEAAQQLQAGRVELDLDRRRAAGGEREGVWASLTDFLVCPSRLIGDDLLAVQRLMAVMKIVPEQPRPSVLVQLSVNAAPVELVFRRTNWVRPGGGGRGRGRWAGRTAAAGPELRRAHIDDRREAAAAPGVAREDSCVPKASVVRPPGTSAFEPASIVGLKRSRGRRRLPAGQQRIGADVAFTGKAVLLSRSHASLNEDVRDPPAFVRKPPMSAWPEGLVTIELVSASWSDVLAVDAGDTFGGLIAGDRGVVERELEVGVGFGFDSQAA